MDQQEHPARIAGLLSQRYVSDGNRDAWLDLFAENACLEDPVGVSPMDPIGKGHHGKAAIAAFWDNIISHVQVSFDFPRSYAAGNECAFIGVVYAAPPGVEAGGSEGVFVYRVNDAGKLVSLRAFWEIDRPRWQGELHPPVGRERP